LILVEAMSSGAACLVARVPPMTEIAANAVVYLDPLDPGDVARKLTEVWGDPALRDSLRQRGIARAAEFTWRRTGERVLGVLEQAARAHVR
jgi:glycosyltransferase involved in cell wall biosynthesis